MLNRTIKPLGIAVEVDEDYTVQQDDHTIVVDALTAGLVRIDLLSASDIGVRLVIVKKQGGTAQIFPQGADTIDGQASYLLEGDYPAVELVSVGDSWVVIGSNR